MNHLKGWKILRKDEARRLRYQEAQSVQAKAIEAHADGVELPEGQLKSFVSRLIK